MTVHSIENTDVIAYHQGCPDGFTAYWILKRFVAPNAEGIACAHGRELDVEQFRGKAVTFVDFCPPIDKLKEVIAAAKSVRVLDHHETAMKACAAEWGEISDMPERIVLLGNLEWGMNARLEFDMSRSGAGLAWEAAASSRTMPQWIDHVQDRDLWKFELRHTPEVCAAISSLPYTLQTYDEISLMPIEYLVTQGRAIERYRQQLIEEAVSRHFIIELDGTEVWATNCIYALGSDVAGRLAEMNPAGVGAYYIDSSASTHAVPGDPDSWIWHPVCEVNRRWGLRSRNGGPNVAELAARLDPKGGGHAAASGFASTYFLNVPDTEQ